ncbi:uncharacterized protein LOC122388053 [Amphibalanus amphitrite]|uniref:uncharacterized protein LOC122388053 n=1 Tax=Amphibalanus amphitrite TaxID=1232801 RepID=UPI001C8FE15B|nr:uncharacterized protein LOC122388053 [Amphibalanus amphitrite]
MYFTPRMLYVGDDSTERTVSRGSRSGRRSDRARRTRASSRRPRTVRRDSRQAGWGPPEPRRPPSQAADNPRYNRRYQEETECPRTPHDPDGDCIKGEAGADYPTLDTIPRTGFTCRGRPAGYYADEETRCQVWHYCSPTHVRQSFLCTRGTVFNQQHLVCDWWYAVECGRSDSFHYVNNRLYGAAERAEEPSDDSRHQEYSGYTGPSLLPSHPHGPSTEAPATVTSTVPRPVEPLPAPPTEMSQLPPDHTEPISEGYEREKEQQKEHTAETEGWERIKVRRRLRKVRRRRPKLAGKGGERTERPSERVIPDRERTSGEERHTERDERDRGETPDKYTQARTERMRTKQQEMKLRQMKTQEQGRLLREEKLRRARQDAALKTKRGERPRWEGEERPRSRQREPVVTEGAPSPSSSTSTTSTTSRPRYTFPPYRPTSTTERPRYTFPPYRPSKDSATPPGELPFGARLGKRKKYGG